MKYPDIYESQENAYMQNAITSMRVIVIYKSNIPVGSRSFNTIRFEFWVRIYDTTPKFKI